MSDGNFIPLGRKLLVAILGTTSLALLLAFFLNIFPMFHSYRQEAVNRASALSELMATSLAAAVDFEDKQAASENLSYCSMIPNVIGAAVYMQDGRIFASYGDIPEYENARSLIIHTYFSDLTVATPVTRGDHASVLVMRISLGDQWSVLARNVVITACIFCIVFFISWRVAASFRRKLGGPIRQLSNAVSDISRSKDYSRRVDYESDDEIGLFVQEFNSMLEQIEHRDRQLNNHREHLEREVERRTVELKLNKLELLSKNRTLMKEIRDRIRAEMIKDEVERINRHDLKSSLSLVIGYPELILSDEELPDRHRDAVKRIRAAGYRMLDMIQTHLDMFKMEKGIYSLSLKPVDMVETACTLEEEFGPLLSSSGVKLGIELDGKEVVGDEEFCISGEEPLLRAMLRNLIQNAIEASGQNDKVVIRFEEGRKKRVSIHNTAPVPKEVRNRMFDKYVTHGKENGTGLGTYFAALIARTHGASIFMNTSDGEGTTVTVLFRSQSMTKVGSDAA